MVIPYIYMINQGHGHGAEMTPVPWWNDTLNDMSGGRLRII